MSRIKKPDAQLARDIAAKVTGAPVLTARRFATGARHYVFEVTLKSGLGVVVRIGDASARGEMAGALQLSGKLKPGGVPLPEILAHDIEARLPWLVLERLPGTDLGAVAARLSEAQLDRIAAGVARAQAITARTGSAGLYGFSPTPERAPYGSWWEVLQAGLARSRQRIAAARLFDPNLTDAVQAALAAHRGAIDQVAATPFLHDTTTKNVIIASDGTLSGIVDVDDLCFGDARYPAALTLAAMLAYGGPQIYVARWLEHAGASDDALFRSYVALFLLDLMSEHGHVFNGNAGALTPEARGSLHVALEDNLKHAQG